MSALTDVSQGPRRPRRGDFLAALDPSASREVPKSATRGRHLGRSSFDEDAEDVVEKAEEAEAVTSLASAELRKVLQESNEASEDALAAAQVAVITEAVAFVGCLAGFCSSWIGWKMNSAQLPPESKIPTDSGVPPELLTPPPSIDTTARASLKAKAPPQPKATVPSRGSSSVRDGEAASRTAVPFPKSPNLESREVPPPKASAAASASGVAMRASPGQHESEEAGAAPEEPQPSLGEATSAEPAESGEPAESF